ncbi:MAG: transporter substrate-binding protein [Herminiimonas sp.]|nr:transporter substrate-binding protein [Herminiimonas sp.]
MKTTHSTRNNEIRPEPECNAAFASRGKVRRMLGGLFPVLLAFGLVSASDAENVKIRVGITASTSLPPVALYYGIKTGAFKKEGLDVEVKSFIQSSQKNDTMKAGGLDVDLDMSAITAAQLYSNGVPIVVVRAISPADIWAVVAKKDSTLSKPQDFKGKKFGVAALSGTNFGITYFAFKTANVDLMRDVKVSALPPAALITALDKGDLDGATLYEPFVTQALNTGRIKVLFRPGDTYEKFYKEPFVALVSVARKDFYNQNKAAVAKFVSVMEKSLASLDANLDVAAEAVVSGMPELKSTPAEIKEIMRPYVKGYIKEGNDPAFVQKIQTYYDRLYEVKQLQAPVKAADFWVKP